MSDVWQTKDGRRRVRRDPPTVEDAVQAAQGLADDIDGQVEIDMSLMEVSAEEARGAVLRMAQRKETNSFTVAGRTGAPRTVVVERRMTRRPLVRPAIASAGFRGPR
jgi:hypothetical protein